MGVLAAVNNAMQSEESQCHTLIIGSPSLSSWANSISDTVTTINVEGYLEYLQPEINLYQSRLNIYKFAYI
jgi:hypothetical protein